ncbi:MAG: ammonium transporter [Burkholderiaceae bacterium]
MIVATVFVFMMTIPGLSLFYSGLVRLKNAIAIQTQILLCFASIFLAWILAGYAITFSGFLDFTAITDRLLFLNVSMSSLVKGAEDGRMLPEYLYALFQGAFAVITCALVIGAMAERLRVFGAIVFVLLWLFFAYVPIAHLIWYSDGLLANWGILDFAGGMVVHLNAGIAGLAAAYSIDNRQNFGEKPLAPHSLNSVLTGTALLWLGWVGFNAGSALGATNVAALAFINTMLAPCAACIAWVLLERARYGISTALGGASGVLAGLIAVTPAAGFVAPWAAILIGVAATFASFYAVSIVKRSWKVDDALDVFALHGVSGVIGSLLLGVFAFNSLGGQMAIPTGMTLVEAVIKQVGLQALACLIVALISGVATIGSLAIANKLTQLLLEPEEEELGLDAIDHQETAYNFLNE